MKTVKQPVFFFGHGSPLNVIDDNDFTREVTAIGKDFARDYPRPRAILVVSAHWATRGRSLVCAAARPEQIYDFYGFPSELYAARYRPAGSPEFACRTAALAGDPAVGETESWGLDHGAWSILTWLFPAADIPVFQLSLDMSMPLDSQLALGKKLRPLRGEGVLIIGSGNVTHNLGEISFESETAPPPAWATAFDQAVARAVESRSDAEFLKLAARGDFRRAHPGLDHFLPMLYALGASDADDSLEFIYEGFQNLSLSMRAWKYF
jgi:4,5-DOPA dioxygenase extradiol